MQDWIVARSMDPIWASDRSIRIAGRGTRIDVHVSRVSKLIALMNLERNKLKQLLAVGT